MEWRRLVKVTSGCPNKSAWGNIGVVIAEHRLNGEEHSVVDINGDWLLVNNVYAEPYEER